MNLKSTWVPIEHVDEHGDEHSAEAERARETLGLDEMMVVFPLLAFMVFFFYFVFVR